MNKLRRGITYALVGFSTDATFSALHDRRRGYDVTLRTSPWTLPIYALVLPLYEPLHDRLRSSPRWARAAAYGAGFLAVEYSSGAAIRALRGTAPWDYAYARHHIDGLIRPDYFFLWAAAGLLLEPLHDRLRNERITDRSLQVPHVPSDNPR
jgi:hypothetical protein